MGTSHTFLSSLAIVFSVAALTTVVSRKARLPGIFGYLLAGLVVGPHTPIPLLADQAVVQSISELGVILLMFSLGLEFSPRRVVAIGSRAGLPAIAETSLMFGLGFTVASFAGWSPTERLFTGAIVAISSTTVIARTFVEHPVAPRLQELVYGILLVEDLIAMLLIAALSTLSAGGAVGGSAMLVELVRLATFLVLLVTVGRLVVPRFVRLTLRQRSAETTAVAAVGIAFGAALLASSLGYSVALGAFIAGSLASEGDPAHEVWTLIAPLRDIFVAVFFVSAGMLIDPVAITQHWGAVAALTTVVILGKLLAVSIGMFLTGQSLQVSLQAGLSLAQIGEFSFILASVGLAGGATRPFLYPVAIAVSAITTLSTPWLVRRAADIARLVDRRLPRPLQTMLALYGSWLPRAMATGNAAGLRRQVRMLLLDLGLLAGLLMAASVEMDRLAPFVSRTLGVAALWGRVVVIALAGVAAVPLVAGIVRLSRRTAELVALRALPAPAHGSLDRAAAPRRAFTSTLQFGILMASALPLVALLRPLVPSFPALTFLAALAIAVLVVVWRNANALYGHARAGAEVILLALTQHDRAHASEGEVASTMSHLSQLLPGLGDPILVRLSPHHPAVGRTLRELDLRGRTGAMILAIRRENAEGTELVTPDGGVHVLAGDCVAVAGAVDAVRAARDILVGPPPVPPA